MRKEDGTVFKQENPWLEAALEKLARYEDAEDEGRLIVLPKKPERLDLSRTAELILADEEGRVVIKNSVSGPPGEKGSCMYYERNNLPRDESRRCPLMDEI